MTEKSGSSAWDEPVGSLAHREDGALLGMGPISGRSVTWRGVLWRFPRTPQRIFIWTTSSKLYSTGVASPLLFSTTNCASKRCGRQRLRSTVVRCQRLLILPQRWKRWWCSMRCHTSTYESPPRLCMRAGAQNLFRHRVFCLYNGLCVGHTHPKVSEHFLLRCSNAEHVLRGGDQEIIRDHVRWIRLTCSIDVRRRWALP